MFFFFFLSSAVYQCFMWEMCHPKKVLRIFCKAFRKLCFPFIIVGQVRIQSVRMVTEILRLCFYFMHRPWVYFLKKLPYTADILWISLLNFEESTLNRFS